MKDRPAAVKIRFGNDRTHLDADIAGDMAKARATKPCEWNDPSARTHAAFANPPRPMDGLFHLQDGRGLGLVVNETELVRRRLAPG